VVDADAWIDTELPFDATEVAAVDDRVTVVGMEPAEELVYLFLS
jgi:hypothetical protein